MAAMNLARHSNFIATLWLGALLLFAGVAMDATVQAEEISVVFRKHSVITVELNGTQLPWVSVAKDGSMVDRMIPVAQIQSLSLSKSKSSDLLAEVRQNLERLGDDDYNAREKAETDLAKNGGSFRKLIERYVDHPSMEVRHRVQRLLKKFARTNSPPVELDRLVLTDGSVLEGEAKDFKAQADYRGNKLLLERRSVMALRRPSATPPPDAPEPARIEIINQHKQFVAPGQQEFRFETNADGSPFPDRANIDRAFTDMGLRFRNAGDQGYVGVSVFSFKYDDLPVGGRSVCLYSQGRNRKQFQGVMEISFCVPGNPERPAGVNEAGLFIARVKHSRDLVMEAYNAQGHVLATVEATDQQCVFTGLKSNELITKLKIFSNPWLDKLSRKIDVDFAIDTLRISPPIEVSTASGQVNGGRRMHLKNGDLLIARSITVTPDNRWRVRLQEPSAEFIFDKSEVSDISFGLRDKPTAGWSAMLLDGSIVDVKPGKELTSSILKRTLSPPEIVGLWPPGTPPRYPLNGDLTLGTSVVVFPTCRVRSAPLRFNTREVSWTKMEKLQQKLVYGRENPRLKENQEDPTPSETRFAWNNTTANQKPTLWNALPEVKLPGPGQGVIDLIDGQRLIFGEAEATKLKSLKRMKFTFVHQGPEQDEIEIAIPIAKIRSIKFP